MSTTSQASEVGAMVQTVTEGIEAKAPVFFRGRTAEPDFSSEIRQSAAYLRARGFDAQADKVAAITRPGDKDLVLRTLWEVGLEVLLFVELTDEDVCEAHR